LEKSCESDKKSKLDEMQVKHDEVVQQLKDDIAEQNSKEM